MDDDEYAAGKLHQDGERWEAVAKELGCTPATVRALAGAYVERTNVAAFEVQGQLL